MRLGGQTLGTRGALILGAAGLLGVVLAIHGYGHGTAAASGTGGIINAAGQPTASKSTTPRSPSTTTSRPSSTSTTTSHPSSTSTTKASSSSASSGQKLGPSLSSTQYAAYAYQVYPAPVSSQASLATTGFDVHVTPSGNSIVVHVAVAGSSQAVNTATYPAGDHVYFVETSFGDDSGNTDYSFGDDGVLVTNANGRIVK